MKTLKDLIERFKKINKIAVIDKKDYRKFSYTYKQLYLLSKKFSLLLNENRIKKGDKILVWSQNGIEYLSILFGSILQGVILVPIDLRSNLDFVKKIQKQVKAKLILQTKYKPKSSLKTIFIEDLLSLLENTTNKNSLPKINPSDIVEILYTSGTTGEPKGVILTHKNFISNFNSIIKIEALDSDSKFLSLIPLSHIFEQTVGLFIPLYFKTTIVYIKTLKTSTLFETFKEENITNAIVVPRILELIKSGILQKVVALNQHFQFHFLLKIAQLFHLSLRKLLFKEIHEILGYNLKYFICGGAPLDIDLERFYEALGIPVVQGYGLTETSPILTTNLINDRKIGSVGKVISNVKLKILDNEILAKGNNITKGYYKNPEKTREAFEDSWFKTGDLGYFKNKFLYLKGRKKEVIVTQAGIKVYPEDVEKILNKIRGVKDSCVLGIKGKKGEEVYAVLLLKEKLNAQNIIEEANKNLDISQKIKDYSIWPFEDFPRTTTLKIKKFEVKDFIEKKIKPIITQKKSKVYNILSKLSNKKIKPNLKLQDLGLSSIDIIELTSLLEQEFNIELEEEKINPYTKVKDLEKIIKFQRFIEAKSLFRKWALNLFINTFRFLFQQLIFFPILNLIFHPKIEGQENLKELKSPVIFAANHVTHLDTPLILMSLPSNLSKNIAIAAWQEFFFNEKMEFKNLLKKSLFYLATIFFNIYPLPQQKGFRKSIRYTGKLINKNWNILIFPEGQRTRTGQISSFKQGIGVLAVEMKIPVIPIKFESAIKIFSKFKPKFKRTKIKIGKPLLIKDISYIKATKIVENTIKNL